MKAETEFWYSTVWRGEASETRHPIKTSRRYPWKEVEIDEWDVQRLAEECAADFHNEHDGWESTWPIVFVLYASEDGPEVARFEVCRETRPEFSATRVRP